MIDHSTSADSRKAALASKIGAIVKRPGPLNDVDKAQLAGLLRQAESLEPELRSEQDKRESRAFTAFLRGGREAMLHADLAHLHPASEQRDMLIAGGAPTGSAYGPGVLVPVEFNRAVSAALRDFSPLLALSNLVETGTGRKLSYPNSDDTSISAQLVGEGQQLSTQDVAALGQSILGAYRFSTMLKLSNELLRDQEADLDAYLLTAMGTRLARGISRYATSGSGSNQPLGFLAGDNVASIAAQGAYANDGSSGPNSIGTGDVANLIGAVDPAYRSRAVFMANDGVILKMRAQVDKQGRPLWPGLSNSPDGVDRLFNYPIYPNPFMDELQSGPSSPVVNSTVLAFADFSRFVVRRTPLVFQRSVERFAEQDMTAFFATIRADCKWVDEGACAATLTTIY